MGGSLAYWWRKLLNCCGDRNPRVFPHEPDRGGRSEGGPPQTFLRVREMGQRDGKVGRKDWVQTTRFQDEVGPARRIGRPAMFCRTYCVALAAFSLRCVATAEQRCRSRQRPNGPSSPRLGAGTARPKKYKEFHRTRFRSLLSEWHARCSARIHIHTHRLKDALNSNFFQSILAKRHLLTFLVTIICLFQKLFYFNRRWQHDLNSAAGKVRAPKDFDESNENYRIEFVGATAANRRRSFWQLGCTVSNFVAFGRQIRNVGGSE